MNRTTSIAACLFLLPGAALAATRTYDTGAFEAVAVAAGVDVEISLGASRSVIAETTTKDFEDLRVEVEGTVLRIGRPSRGWFMFRRPSYKVRVVTPVLKSLVASSGSDVDVKGPLQGDFSVEASSGSDVGIALLQGGNVKARASSGSDLELSGSCRTLEVEASSGSDLDARDLRCETVMLQASSGSDLSVSASQRVTGKASSGSDVDVSGAPPVVEVDRSSGADISVGNQR